MEFVVPSDTVGAFSLIGAAVGQVVGNQATAGIGHTHCTVHKAFQQDVGTVLADLAHFFKCNFAAENA